MRNIPKPEYEYGYTSEEIKSFTKEGEWEDFLYWMCGQTAMVHPYSRKIIYYTWDVVRFLKKIDSKKPTYFD